MQKGLFITVNYGNAEMTIDLLKNLFHLSGIESFEIAVVDNSPMDEDFQKLQEFKKSLNQPSLMIFKPEMNLGYFGGANFILKNENYLNKEFQYVIISNNDIEIRDQNFFRKLMALNEDVAVIAPDIISTLTGRHHNPHFLNPINRWQKFQYKLLFSGFLIGWILHQLRTLAKSLKNNNQVETEIHKQEIFSAYGAFMIFDKKYFQSGGFIDYGYFLYGEETSVSAQCRDLKLKILYCPELIVFHKEHTTTQSHGFKRKIYKLQRNAYMYIKKHYTDFY
jgi:GT2 family glycosyltransferase